MIQIVKVLSGDPGLEQTPQSSPLSVSPATSRSTVGTRHLADSAPSLLVATGAGGSNWRVRAFEGAKVKGEGWLRPSP